MKYYKYYSNNLNFINATPLDYRHFDLIFQKFDSRELSAWIFSDGNTVAGGLISFYYEPLRTMYGKYLALNRDVPRTYTPTYSLYWNAINQAHEMGCKAICLGSTSRDPHSGHYKLKERMGCVYEGKRSYYIPRNDVFWKAFKGFRKLDSKLFDKNNGHSNGQKPSCPDP
jgi:hypothetical protein